MAYTRANALTYLQNQYAALCTLTGQITTDSDAGYGPAIDDALMTLGTSYSDLPDATANNADVPAFRALLRYHALKHFAQKLAAKVDFAVTGSSASVRKETSKQLQQVRELMKEAASEVEAFGYSVSGGGWAIGSLNLDFLEPSESGL